MIKRSILWTTQPQGLVSLNPKYAKYVSAARIWSTPPSSPECIVYSSLAGFAKTGTIDVVPSIGGVGVKGDGSTGLYSRSISVVPQASWIMAQFVAGATSTALKCVHGLGSSAASAGAYQGIFTGDGAANTINCQLRPIDGGATQYIQKYGPAPVAGQLYTVIGVFPSNLKADAYMYVNGVRYVSDLLGSTDITFVAANTWVNESVGALKRGATGTYSSDTVLFTARGVGQMPEDVARQISENPYSLLQPQQRRIFIPASSDPAGVGSASMVFSASATGSALFKGIGSSAISFTCAGVGSYLGGSEGVGSASISFSAPGVGKSIFSAYGSSDITFSAAGVGKSNSASVGSSAISFNAAGVGTSSGGTTLMPAAGNATMSFDVNGYGNALRSYTWDDVTYSSNTWTDIITP